MIKDRKNTPDRAFMENHQSRIINELKDFPEVINKLIELRAYKEIHRDNLGKMDLIEKDIEDCINDLLLLSGIMNQDVYTEAVEQVRILTVEKDALLNTLEISNIIKLQNEMSELKYELKKGEIDFTELQRQYINLDIKYRNLKNKLKSGGMRND